MTGTVQSQLIGLAVTVLAGMIMGLSFDLYRVARWAFRLGRALTAIFDVLFWILAATLVFAFLLAYSWGEVRFYMLVGFAMGFGVYRLIFGRRIVGGAVSAYEHAKWAQRRLILGYREGTLRLRRAEVGWRKRARKISAYFGSLWLKVKKELCFWRKES